MQWKNKSLATKETTYVKIFTTLILTKNFWCILNTDLNQGGAFIFTGVNSGFDEANSLL